MGFIVLFIIIVLIIVIASSGTSENITTVRNSGENKHPENMGRKPSTQAGPAPSNYDEDAYEYYEIRAARGERDYFSEDAARDYDSYYAQVADAAEMGDQYAIDEMRGEFGEGEW